MNAHMFQRPSGLRAPSSITGTRYDPVAAQEDRGANQTTTIGWKVFWFYFQLAQSIALTGVIFGLDEVSTLETPLYITVIGPPSNSSNYGRWESTSQPLEDDYPLPLHYVYFLVPWCTVVHYAIVLYYLREKGPQTLFPDALKFWRVCSSNTNEVWSQTVLFSTAPLLCAIRWIEYAFSASLMTFVVGILSSVTDINALMGLVATNLATQYCGYIADRNDLPLRLRKMTFVAGAVVFATTWIPLLCTFFNAVRQTNDDGNDVPNFVYYVVFGITGNYLVFPTILGLRVWGVLDPTARSDENGPSGTTVCFGRCSTRWSCCTCHWLTSSDHWFDIASFLSKAYLDWTIVIGMYFWVKN